MNIDYRKIIFNNNYISFVVKATFITLLFNVFLYAFFVGSLTTVVNNFENKINNKYSYEVIKYYAKGIVSNPYAFIKSAEVYKLVGRGDKELEDLQFALALYLNMPNKDNAIIQKIKQRIKILELKEKIEN